MRARPVLNNVLVVVLVLVLDGAFVFEDEDEQTGLEFADTL